MSLLSQPLVRKTAGVPTAPLGQDGRKRRDPFRGGVIRLALLTLAMRSVTVGLQAQALGASTITPNLAGGIEHPLRYHPEGTDFVIVNGAEFFNRPLYGGNTAFRVDAGDRPEFSLYLPGRGGNLRLGVKTAAGAKWLHAADEITARYRPGEMIYEVRDALLGADGTLRVEALALAATEGLIVRVTWRGSIGPPELVWAYGGISGERGRRDGDIGTESLPIAEYFQLSPEACRGNHFEVRGENFTLLSKSATVVGRSPPGGRPTRLS